MITKQGCSSKKFYFYFVFKEDDFGSEDEEEEVIRKPSSLSELKRKQTTAVVILGIIGAEFGQDISSETSGNSKRTFDQRRESSTSESNLIFSR